MKLCAFALCLTILYSHATAKKMYIVQMKAANKPTPFNTRKEWYSASLTSVTSGIHDLHYTYEHAYQGYAASLHPEQAEALRKQDNVLGVYADSEVQLQTTRTPQFLNVKDEFGLWGSTGNNSLQGAGVHHQVFHDVVIGVVDSGISPESKSFDDAGFPDIPKRWKGGCEEGPDFDPTLCNKKLVGAKAFYKGYILEHKNATDVFSPRDHNGHGTHCASTAAGSPVPNAGLFGVAKGTVQGMAPHARIASYKVAWQGGVKESDVLAGIEEAIKDGVDILSLSLLVSQMEYYGNTIAIGTFSAMARGIFVSAAAGNFGPSRESVYNGFPWAMTVGASTLDREFPAYMTLGDGRKFTGLSMNNNTEMVESVSIVHATGNDGSHLCTLGTLDPVAVKGKVVLCFMKETEPGAMALAVKAAGGIGMIVAFPNEIILSQLQPIPTLIVGASTGTSIKQYILSNHSPTARFTFGGSRFSTKPAPAVSAFSSRGPNYQTGILKPDIVAPGQNILAAWAKDASLSPYNQRTADYNIIFGTSMACPHVSGIAALLRVAHPEWSTSAIQSALMTTATIHDNAGRHIVDISTGMLAGPLEMGAGHVNPRKAMSPGLVYNISKDDYVTFICSLNYTSKQIHAVIGEHGKCSSKFSDTGGLNYPSFAVIMTKNKTTVRYTRELTNVGAPMSTYQVKTSAPPSVKVTVQPKTLVFGPVGDKKRYTVTFMASGNGTDIHLKDGAIVWENRKHIVRSPVIFIWK